MGNYRFGTKAIHAGATKDSDYHTISTPIYQTAAYQFDSVDQAQKYFSLQEAGYMYTRLCNPTTNTLEERIAQLEGGAAALATSSGQFAIFAAITTIAGAGDEIISGVKLYGGTYNLFVHTFPKLGINTHLVDQFNIAEVESKINDKTRAIYIETINNPSNDVANFEELSALAKKYKLPIIVDNTFPTPYLCRPIEHGADIVVHSLTKFLGGHGNSIGGVIVDSGKFDWAGSGRFKNFTDPDPSYHGLVYAKDCAPVSFAAKARVQIMRDIGGCLSPLNSYLVLQGVETLHLRMERHSENALKVAKFLQGHKKVKSVSYPGLEDSPNYESARKYLPAGAGAMVSFLVDGDGTKATKVIDSVKLCIHASNLGDVRTLITYPAATTHLQLTSEQREEVGAPDNLIRLSVGVEDVEDIIQDLDDALNSI